MSNYRNSNFEILRIIAILMITSYHYSIHGEINVTNEAQGCEFLLQIVGLWGKAGVNIFSLIMGYYMINKSNISYRKLGTLEIQVLFFSLLGLIIGLSCGYKMAFKDYIHFIFPVITTSYWFITAYYLVYLLSPFINKMIHALNKKEFDRLMIVLFVIWCIIPVFTYQISKGLFWSQFIWFVVMYITGAYLQLNKPRFSKRGYYIVFFLSNLLLIVSVYAIDYVSLIVNISSNAYRYFAWSNSPLIIFMCISLMRLAELKKTVSNNAINQIASLSIGMYLFQENTIFQKLCWHQWFDNSIPMSLIMKICHVFYSVILVCLIGGALEYIRSLVFKIFYKRILS